MTDYMSITNITAQAGQPNLSKLSTHSSPHIIHPAIQQCHSVVVLWAIWFWFTSCSENLASHSCYWTPLVRLVNLVTSTIVFRLQWVYWHFPAALSDKNSLTTFKNSSSFLVYCLYSGSKHQNGVLLVFLEVSQIRWLSYGGFWTKMK